jgi:hypothetical protein
MLWDFILDSSINELAAHVKWTWVVLLLKCNKLGYVRITPQALARAANVPIEQAENALQVLSEPDPSSTTTEHEGRRIVEESPNVWYVVNYEQYWRKAKEAKQRLDTRNRVAKHRKGKTGNEGALHGVTGNGSTVTGNDVYTYTYTYPFNMIWNLVPKGRKVAKVEAKKVWEGEANTSTKERMTEDDRKLALERYPLHVRMWAKEQRPEDKIPHLRTWLYQRRWEDEIDGMEPQQEADGWMYGTYRTSDLVDHGDDPDWSCYLRFATDHTDQHGPRSAPTFTEFKEGSADE